MNYAQPTVIDLLKICYNIRPDEQRQYEILTGIEWDPQRVACEHFNSEGVKICVVDGPEGREEPLVAGGYQNIGPGSWQSWMIGTPAAWEKHWLGITKYTRRFMDDMLKHGNRLQTIVLSDRAATKVWYERGLKMQYEGTMRGLGVNGEDADMYARIA